LLQTYGETINIMEFSLNGKRKPEVVVVTGASAGVGRAIAREFGSHGAMVPRDRGVVVQIGSALTYRAIPLQSAYCGAKHAVQGFTESLRSELIHDGSRARLTIVQLPAVNTSQFSWIKTRMPRHPQPVPPIYQPEVIARSVYWAAHHDRREFAVGYPTVQAIVGDKFIPGLLDHYLARVGYEAQQTNQPIDPDRPNNLYGPLPGDYGARGEFSDRAHEFSIQPALFMMIRDEMAESRRETGAWRREGPTHT
jgi:hypothetical protein